MVMRSTLGLLLAVGLGSCTSRTTAPQASFDAAASSSAETTAAPPQPGAAQAKTSAPAPKGDLASWLSANLPKGGALEGAGDAVKVVHTVGPDDTAATIAAAYLNLTDIYTQKDLEAAITKKCPSLAAGQKCEIPDVVTKPPKPPKEDRLGWPEGDRSLRGIFATGPWAQAHWVDTLDKLAARGLNAVVLDAKDYMGPVNYPTKAKIAVETGAAEKAAIPDLARMIRFAHARGVRIILRIPCFHDPWADKHAKDARLSLRYATSVTDQRMHIDWIDPVNEEAQNYAVELAQEGVDAGADEIQLDYVRFPVHIGQKIAKLPDPDKRPKIIRDFVKKVHAVTEPAGVKLSLDLFGVAATGERSDIERLGQDIPVIGPEADAISPMVYPSHYAKGYNGWDEPGDHPEIVGIGTKAAVRQLKSVKAKTAVRSWIQAFAWHTNIYGAKYVVDQAKSAESNGGEGWLMWSPACDYWAVWNGFPVKEAGTAKGGVAAK